MHCMKGNYLETHSYYPVRVVHDKKEHDEVWSLCLIECISIDKRRQYVSVH